LETLEAFEIPDTPEFLFFYMSEESICGDEFPSSSKLLLLIGYISSFDVWFY
jgi:hypothetical protein